jgi:cytoskeleton protein RodZ
MTDIPLHEVEVSAGETLKKLREEKGLSVQNIAAKLYLDTRIIEALEQNNFSVLPAAMYTRGYLRSYAKLVGADADTIIALYDDNAPGPPEIIPEVKYPTQISSTDKPVRAITWMISLLLALLLMSWLHNIYMMPVDEAVVTGEPAGSTRAEPPPVTEIMETPEYTDDSLMITPDDGQQPEPDLPGEDTVQAEGGLPTGAAEQTILSATDENASGIPAGTDAENQAVSSAEPMEIAAGTDTIHMRFTADSWIEIFDKEGNKLYVNLARTGDEISLTGAAPFSVKLGFSHGVILEFNGEIFDHAPYSQAGIANFILE